MSKQMNYTMTNESIVVSDGGSTHSVQRDAPNYAPLRQAILDQDWDRARQHLTVRASVGKWANGRFTTGADGLLFDGKPVLPEFGGRVMEMVRRGESPDALFRFHERLSLNPSWRSVGQLWGFLQHAGIPLVPSGCFLAYKGVRDDYRDVHSSTFVNKPGAVHRMPRNEISDDADVACHVGFHVGSHQYAVGFGDRVVVCLVDPAHVVCVPKDCSQQKVRVCEYAVVGHYGEPLPSTVTEEPAPAQPREEEFPAATPLTAEDLMEVPLSELHKMARGFRIVGAADITHRLTLVRRILAAVRGNGKA